MTSLRVFLSRLVRKIWFRAACFTAAAVVLALFAGILGPVLPSWLLFDVGQNSVGPILQILATSMLAVTTFSLTAMVTVYNAASQVATPRATQLMVSDPTSQNALSTFLGAFVFAVVGIVALSTNYYTTQGRTVLFLGTLVVIAMIVVTLLGWIDHLAGFGRMADIIDRVEAAATRSASKYADDPYLGGVAEVTVPADAVEVLPERAGFITLLEVAALGRLAERRELTIHVRQRPGSAVHRGQPLACVEGEVTEEDVDEVREAFDVEAHRSYEQDPRLGVTVLSEIASRALSPAINDPGTAIEVLGALERVMLILLDTSTPKKPDHPRVHLPTAHLGDMIKDGFRPIARDGSGHVEVAIRTQKTLAALAQVAGPADATILRQAARNAERRAVAALSEPSDAQAVRDSGAGLGSHRAP